MTGLKWERDTEFNLTTHDGAMEVTGMVYGPFGVHKNATRRQPWVMTELATGRRVCEFYRKANAIQCCEEMTHYVNADGLLPRAPTSRMILDMQKTITHYGEAERVVASLREIEEENEHDIQQSILPEVRASRDAEPVEDYGVTWAQLASYVQSMGSFVSENKYLIGFGHTSVQALVHLDPMRRHYMLVDTVLGLAVVAGKSESEMIQSILLDCK